MPSYTCPYCFAQSDTNIIKFQCLNDSCPNHQTGFTVAAPGLVARMFGKKAPRVAFCPRHDCQEQTLRRACPKCHKAFPAGVDPSNTIIAIIGAKEVGKSNYIAVLIKKIMEELPEQFSWIPLPGNSAVERRYARFFEAPLYKDGYAVERTRQGKDNPALQPLVYTLQVPQGRRQQYKTITLAFFDTAGESLDEKPDTDTIASMSKNNRYIHNAAGIILLVDPLRISQIRKKVILAGIPKQTLPAENNTPATKIIKNTILLINEHKHYRSKKIDIPLAVVFSKVDLLRNILGVDAAVYEQRQHEEGFFNLDGFQKDNDCIRAWIKEYDKEFIPLANAFKDSAFFGVSALGNNPDENKKLSSELLPIRVEAPFLWLLWKNGIIDGR